MSCRRIHGYVGPSMEWFGHPRLKYGSGTHFMNSNLNFDPRDLISVKTQPGFKL